MQAGPGCRITVNVSRAVLPEDDSAGLKHAGGFYAEDNTHVVHLLVIITLM
jgi:hypothetical protein